MENRFDTAECADYRDGRCSLCCKRSARVKYVKPASVEEAERKALPILQAGYDRRGQPRAAKEREKRAQVKLDRDDQAPQRPRICAL